MSILYICKQVHVDKANMEYATREVDSRSPLNQRLVAAIAGLVDRYVCDTRAHYEINGRVLYCNHIHSSK